MNDEAKVELQRILDLGPDSISESELAFLQARRSYLTDEQRINFGITEEAISAQGEDAQKPGAGKVKAGSPTKGKAASQSESAK
jgi:hypothetical protein